MHTPGTESRQREHIVKQGLRFLVFGGLTVAIGFGLFALLQYEWGRQLHYMGAWSISTVTGLIVGFFLQRRFVFKARGRMWPDFTRFAGVNATSIGFNAAALPILVSVIGVNAILSQFLITATTTVYNFVAHRFFTFARRENGEGEQT